MAELADAPDLGSGVYDVQVQVLLSAVKKCLIYRHFFSFALQRLFSCMIDRCFPISQERLIRSLSRRSAGLHGSDDNGLCR